LARFVGRAVAICTLFEELEVRSLWKIPSTWLGGEEPNLPILIILHVW
jgi:hypothetical protein